MSSPAARRLGARAVRKLSAPLAVRRLGDRAARKLKAPDVRRLSTPPAVMLVRAARKLSAPAVRWRGFLLLWLKWVVER